MNRVIPRMICSPMVGALALLCACLLVLPMPAQAAGEAESQDSDKQAKAAEPEATPPESVYIRATTRGREAKDSNVKVFTNEDLEGEIEVDKKVEGAYTLTGTPAPPRTAPSLAELRDRVDPLKELEAEQAAADSRRERISTAERELDAARKKLANLEVQQRATRNPFSKRPQLSDEEKEIRATSGENAAQRAERTDEMVTEAKADVATAEKRLSAARRR